MLFRGKAKGKEKPRKNSETSCSVSLESLDDDSILADELEIKQEFQVGMHTSKIKVIAI